MFLTVSGGIAHTNYSATQYTPKHSGLFMRLANRPPSFWRKNGNEGPLQLSCLADRPPIDYPQLSTPIKLLSNSKQIPHINLWAIFYGTLIVYRLSVALPIINMGYLCRFLQDSSDICETFYACCRRTCVNTILFHSHKCPGLGNESTNLKRYVHAHVYCGIITVAKMWK